MTEHYPNKVPFIFHMNNGLALTYAELKDRSYLLASNLISIGLKKGDRIAFLLPNTHELLIGYFAASLAGLVLVPFDAKYGANKIEYMLKNTAASAVFLYNCCEFQTLIGELFPELDKCELHNFVSAKIPSLRHVIVIDDHTNEVKAKFRSAWSYTHLATKLLDDKMNTLPYVDPDDVFAILSTVPIFQF